MPKDENAIRPGFDLDAFKLPEKAVQKHQANAVDPKKIIRLIFSKIKRNDSFHTFSSQIGQVNKILQMKYASANDIAQAILNDVPLTAKLLKLVNSSFYAHFSTEGISTITEAMIIVGTDQIKFLAASLKLIELMQNLGDSNILKEKTLKSLQRGIIAGQIAKEGGFVSSEKLQVSSLLYDFGEYLVTAFSPDTYKKVNAYREKHNTDLDVASKAVMGISYKGLSLLVANKWHMPKTVTNTMKPITNYDVKKSEMGPEDYLPFACAFANDLSDIKLGDSKEEIEDRLNKTRELYAGLFNIPADTLVDIIKVSEEKIAKHASVLNISTKPKDAETATCIKDEKLIEDGIGKIKARLETEFNIQEIFESALQCLHDGFNFTNINFCIKNKQTDSMNARYVLGTDKEAFLKNFKFKIMKSGDLFNQSLHKDAIIVVEDIEKSRHKAQIPLWFKKNDFSRAFAVVPIGLENRIVSMLYLDWNPDQTAICKKTKDYLSVFRALIIHALRIKR
ncbi:MAG: HDOD domain-containing protein [Desulfobacterales bacterium]|nr:HDOD domain-containing protein [Desulfobacterales bacterium]